MTLTGSCHACGACCDPVNFDMRAWRRSLGKDAATRRAVIARWRAAPDPTQDDWSRWEAQGWESVTLAKRAWLNYRFLLDHWHDLGTGDTLCDAFTEDTKQCLLHETRPPVCREYPWYGGKPVETEIDLYPWCGYAVDVGREPEPVPVYLQPRPRG